MYTSRLQHGVRNVTFYKIISLQKTGIEHLVTTEKIREANKDISLQNIQTTFFISANGLLTSL